jgi:hypothetical protein
VTPGGETIREAGYLSTEAFNAEPSYLETYKTPLNFFQQANHLAMRALFLMPQESDPPFDGSRMFIATTLLSIAIRRCEAAVLLAYKRLSFEADTLSRSALEATMILGSYLSDPDRVLKEIDGAEVKTKKAAANSMLSLNKKRPFLTPEQSNELAETLAQMASMTPSNFNLEVHAQYGDMEMLYLHLFRRLSFTSSHVTATLLERHTTWGDDERQVEFGPDEDASRPCIDALIILMNAIATVVRKFKLEEILDETKHLMNEAVKLKPGVS